MRIHYAQPLKTNVALKHFFLVKHLWPYLMKTAKRKL
jgi:hypothetical protein